MAHASQTTILPTQGNSEDLPAPASQVQLLNRPNSMRGSRQASRGGQIHDGPRGGRRGRGGIRGNRANGAHNHQDRRFSNTSSQTTRLRPPPSDPGGGGSFGVRPTEDAESKEGEGERKQQEEIQAREDDQDVEAEVCFICASPVVHNSVAPCNHRTCHICALRLRALYKNRACAHCRTEARYVIFTDNSTKKYEDFVDSDFQEVDDVLGIRYEQKEIHSDTVLLLRYNCPDHDCDIACWGWPDLHRHVKSVHHKVLCDLCTRNKKVFTHEHELFTQQELRKHEKFGDDHPGAVDQSGFKGHPECGFCRQRFYGDDELYVHCREKHEKCHVCERQNPARQQQYYVDYNSLEQHFSKDHFLCADQECIDKKFVVFASEMDLKAHQLEAHPNGLTKDARRDARRVDISGFDYRTPHQEPQRGRGGREGRGRGRGRDPNVEPLPHSTAQPLRRDELAYQRRMAIHNAQSAAARTFGGQLASTDAYAARPSSRAQDTVTVPRGHTSSNNSVPAIDNLNLNSSVNTSPSNSAPSPNLTPQEQARQLQHSAVMDRASTMLKNNQSKISSFRSSVSSYRTSTITASQLIDSFFSIFDVSSSDLGKLIKELAEIYESEAKRNNLLKAWNDWRAVNEDYPSLPGPSGILPGSSAAAAGSGGWRVLKLKSSTAQSSRSAVSKQGSWGNASAASNQLPSTSANRAGEGRVSAIPWVAPSAPTPTPRPVAANRPNAGGADAFPALPAAAKPNTTIMGLTRGTVRWDDRNGTVAGSAWGATNGTSNSSRSATSAAAAATAGVTGVNEEGDLSKKKGSKNKKQTLYKFG